MLHSRSPDTVDQLVPPLVQRYRGDSRPAARCRAARIPWRIEEMSGIQQDLTSPAAATGGMLSGASLNNSTSVVGGGAQISGSANSAVSSVNNNKSQGGNVTDSGNSVVTAPPMAEAHLQVPLGGRLSAPVTPRQRAGMLTIPGILLRALRRIRWSTPPEEIRPFLVLEIPNRVRGPPTTVANVGNSPTSVSSNNAATANPSRLQANGLAPSKPRQQTPPRPAAIRPKAKRQIRPQPPVTK